MKQNYRCFVCGRNFEDLELYKDHILQDHAEEKDRMWLECPMCHYPVRDLKAHWDLKHKHSPLPKLPTYKATVWKDWSSSKKKMIKSNKNRKNWKSGYFLSVKNCYQQLHYRSSWELEIMKCLEDFNEVKTYKGEGLAIPYQLNGEPHLYYPDFLIEYTDGTTLMAEIKPKRECSDAMNRAKWEAAQAYCHARGWKFEVWTENHISELKGVRQARIDAIKLSKINPDITIL